MRGKILIVTGLAVGYVLGARAGRERYEEIRRAATKFWNDPRVKHQVEVVEDFAKDKAPEVVDFISDNAKKVASQVRGTVKSGTAKSGTVKNGTVKKGGSNSSSSTAASTSNTPPAAGGTPVAGTRPTTTTK